MTLEQTYLCQKMYGKSWEKNTVSTASHELQNNWYNKSELIHRNELVYFKKNSEHSSKTKLNRKKNINVRVTYSFQFI